MLLPGLGRERQSWIRERATEALAMALTARDCVAQIAPKTREELLVLSGTSSISLQSGGQSFSLVSDRIPQKAETDIDLSRESMAVSVWRAGLTMLGASPTYSRYHVTSEKLPQMRVAIVIAESRLAKHLRHYAERETLMAVLLALVTGSLAFASLDRLLVRPMAVITANIAGFRRNPGSAARHGLMQLGKRDDEIGRAVCELLTMQEELRAALWRNARLAALGTSVAKINHDLRNILSSAMLVADRIHRSGDPVIKQAAETLLPAMERATELLSRTVDYVHEGLPAVTRTPVALRALIEEAAKTVCSGNSKIVVNNMVGETLTLSLDPNQIYRVLVNLLGNAVEAGARQITVSVRKENERLQLFVADDGPGLPPQVIANLFRPFASSGRSGGTGLGLAIARDLVRAHGGDLLLRHTGPEGTEFAASLVELTEASETPTADEDRQQSD